MLRLCSGCLTTTAFCRCIPSKSRRRRKSVYNFIRIYKRFYFFSQTKSIGFLNFGETTPERDFLEEITRETTWDICRKGIPPAAPAAASPSLEGDKKNSIDYICSSILSPSAAAQPATWNRSIEGSTCNPKNLQCAWKSFLMFGAIDPSDLEQEIDETTKCDIVKV